MDQSQPQTPQGILRDTAFLSAYLDRIGYAGSRTPTAQTLCDLHRAHLFAVPFENLDIPLGREIICEEKAFLRKIVEKRRGGFCYEMNGAFAALLRALGFKVTLLSARVPREDGSDGPEFDHLALRVDLEGPWLADVGFGESFLDPLRLETGTEQSQQVGKFRIAEQEKPFLVERIDGRRTWKRQYSFYSSGSTAGRICCYVPLPPDFARVAIHAEEFVHPGDAGGKDHDLRSQTDRDKEWKAGGTRAERERNGALR